MERMNLRNKRGAMGAISVLFVVVSSMLGYYFLFPSQYNE